ncbi:MAG: adenylyltransferase/cytidyltransferase family protein [Saprospiraceae bacterium]|nr:adenylyltransferase/cytidyltransferase family protein [Candidatus Brachybacter algidus]
MNIAVFPGSFDPITIGHYDLIKRAMPLFDKIIVAVGTNSTKSSLFPLEERLGWLKIVFKDEPKISIDHSDFDYEKTISQVNQIISHGIETVFLISNPQYSHISSTIVREVIKGNGNVEPFLPKGVVILMSNE